MLHPKGNVFRYWRTGHDFRTECLLIQYAGVFCNCIVTTFCGSDVSLCFTAFDSNISPNSSVFINGTLDYTCQKYSENYGKRGLICSKISYICKWAEMTC